MRIYRKAILILFVYGSIVGAVQAAHPPDHVDDHQQDANSLVLLDAAPLDEVAMYEDGYKISPTLSPDGTKLAWLTFAIPGDDICIYTFATEETVCLAREGMDGLPWGLFWSPDSRYIAMHEDVLRGNHEPDIWLADTVAATLTNLTDDGVATSRDMPLLEPDFPDTPLDTEPVWNHNNDLYFLRTAEGEHEREFTTTLMRFPAQDGVIVPGEPEAVKDLTDSPINGFGVWSKKAPDMAGLLHGSALLSPDGSRMALLVDVRRESQQINEIWILDVESLELALMTTRDELVGPGLPADYGGHDEPGAVDVIYSMAWHGDGLLVAVSDAGAEAAITLGPYVYYLNPDGSLIRPLFDFTNLDDYRERSQAMSFALPLPGTDAIVTVSRTADDFMVRIIGLDGALIQEYSYAALGLEPRRSANALSAGTDGATMRVLIDGNLFSFGYE